MKNINVALAVIALSSLLVGCGGGGTAAGNADVFSQPHPVVTDAGPLAALTAPTRLQAASVRTPDPTSFLNWAESAYPQFLPPTQSTKVLDVWTYRYYPSTDIYLGTNTSGDVLGLLGKGGGAYDSIPLGKIGGFVCFVYPSDCAVVSTLAGSGSEGFKNDVGTASSFNSPNGVGVDSSGNVYVADTKNHVIRKITPAGVVSTLAGSGYVGFSNGVGTATNFNQPNGVAVDSSGNVYVADTFNNAIRKITPTGVVSTLAGSGSFGTTNGVGTAASFAYPSGVAVDSSGNVYVADTNSNVIRKITPVGMVSTLAGSGSMGSTNGVGTAAKFASPLGVAVDSGGNVYVADWMNNAIRKITSTGVVSTLAGNVTRNGLINGIGTAATFTSPNGVAVDSSGNVYVADTYNNAIRKITPTGSVSTLAGSGSFGSTDGVGTTASFYRPTGIAVDLNGRLFVAEPNNRKIRQIQP